MILRLLLFRVLALIVNDYHNPFCRLLRYLFFSPVPVTFVLPGPDQLLSNESCSTCTSYFEPDLSPARAFPFAPVRRERCEAVARPAHGPTCARGVVWRGDRDDIERVGVAVPVTLEGSIRQVAFGWGGEEEVRLRCAEKRHT